LLTLNIVVDYRLLGVRSERLMGYLRIGELSKLAETNNETLRFYESKGLLEEPRRSDAGYRLYTKTDVQRVQFIMRARKMGFSLKEINELLSLRVTKEESTCGEVKELAENKLKVIEEKVAELNRMKAALQQITDACCGGDESAVHCTILNALDDG
jgi:MerR family Zn(II)-responsive transcriptional regulator of zntA